MNNYLNLVQENLQQHKIRTFHILQEEVKRGKISYQDFLTITQLNKKQFENDIKKETKKLIKIYNKRYLKLYGKIHETFISFFYNPPSLINIKIISYSKSSYFYYVITTTIFYNIPKKEVTKSDFYEFFEVDKNNNWRKISEGDETQEFLSSGKYGELLHLKDTFKNLKNSQKLKIK